MPSHAGRLAFSTIAAASLFAGAASAQVAPDRVYYGKGRPIPMTVSVPEGVSGPARIALYQASSQLPIETAEVRAGPVDLAGLFPVLWTTGNPVLLYAQLEVGENNEPIGAPIVLQPLVTPEYAPAANPQTADPQWTRAGSVYSGIRAYTDRHVILDTSEGEIELRMRPDAAPNTAFNFIQLVEGGFYTDIIFHRVVPRLPDGSQFVIQAGDPTGQGSGGPGYFIDLERSALPHDFGVISMARASDPNSNGSQFFLCLSKQGTARLDGKYTAFGETVRGAEAILAIENTPVNGQRPTDPPVIREAYTVMAPPFGKRPDAEKRPTGDTAQ